MKLTGEVRVTATEEQVWSALNDPDVLARCLPGCERLERDGEDGFRATAVAAVGPVRARFAGRLRVRAQDPPHAWRVEGEGQGGAAGFVRGAASVRLRRDGEATVIAYGAEATVGGKLAQLGGRMIDPAARAVADSFFANLQGEFAAGDRADAAAGAGRRIWVAVAALVLVVALTAVAAFLAMH